MGKKRRKLPPFRDELVVFYSKKDKCWIAHSLKTDQFGTGGCVLDALVDGMKAVDQVVLLASTRDDIQLFCEAPASIKKIASNAKPLPDELFELAYKRLYGGWPDYIKIKDVLPHNQTFVKPLREPVTA